MLNRIQGQDDNQQAYQEDNPCLIQKFTAPTARPLPVVLLLDVSGSMSGEKIDNLNKAVRDMLMPLRRKRKWRPRSWFPSLLLAIRLSYMFPTPGFQVQWQGLQASGMTPMGTALEMAKAMIEDKETTPSRAYRPTIVLVSDGQPNDRWERPLEDFILEGRSSKCDRMAMAIGRDADEAVLKRFTEGTPHDLFMRKTPGRCMNFSSE
jgi:uncharacterized protein YegL